MTAKLAALLHGYAAIPSALDRTVTAVCDHHREVKPGALFFARRGFRFDANRFVREVIASGAGAVVVENKVENEPVPVRCNGGVVVVGIADVVGAIGQAASHFYGDPSTHLSVAAVTGTNGKTSVTHLIARGCGDRCALMGTLGVGRPDQLKMMMHTTPGAVEIHCRLAGLRHDGFDMLAMEASSQALHQRRIEAVRVDTAVFTNLSRDHIDYHKSMGAYGYAKASLFEAPDLAHAVINVDDGFGRKLFGSTSTGVERIAFTLGDRPIPIDTASVIRGEITGQGFGLSLVVTSPWGSGRLATRLIGRGNAYNLLAAIAVACLHGHPFKTVLERLHGVAPIVGRMQPIGGASHPLVVVDYAHTPDALCGALAALKPMCEGTLWCVFGCGGDRDRGKRSEMARVAQAGADAVIVTDDNPRGENGDAIVADIIAGFIEPGAAHIERDRERAIQYAITHAGVTDIVLIAGKGHELYQERDGVRMDFSDHAVARRALEGWR